MSPCEHGRYGDCEICNHEILKETRRMEKKLQSKKVQAELKRAYEVYQEYVRGQRFLGYSKKRKKFVLKRFRKSK